MTPLNIKSFGADTGKIDNTTQINNALMVGQAQQQPVFAPDGIFKYADILLADSVIFYGNGPNSVLYATNKLRSAIFLRGNGAKVQNLKLSGDKLKPEERGSTRESCRVVARDASNFEMSGLIVDSCAGAGLRADNSTDGVIVNNQVSNTLADSIHITDKSANIVIDYNIINNSGDDGIAVVSYQDQIKLVTGISATGNQISNNVWGRGMSVVGGQTVTYKHNFIDNSANAAGIYLAQEDNYKTFAAHDVKLINNTLRNCGNKDKGHYAIMIFSETFGANTDLFISHNLLNTSDDRGSIRIFNANTNVQLDQNVYNTPMKIQTSAIITPYMSGSVGV